MPYSTKTPQHSNSIEMFTISELIDSHPILVSKLKRFSFRSAAELIGSLGLLPNLLANTIRIEALTHLAGVACKGNAAPNYDNLREWAGKLMANSSLSQQEDPVEDVFVGCVNSSFGSFRLFQGIFGDGAFLVEQLLSFYGNRREFPTFQETIDSAIGLLRISDALADRSGLGRYFAGGGNAGKRIAVPRWRDLSTKVSSLFFSDSDLESMGLTRHTLSPFLLNESHREALPLEISGGSSLERHPLLETEGGVLVVFPSTLARAATRFLIENMTPMGGWAETFYQIESASTFINNVRRQLDIEWLDTAPPTPPDSCPALFPAFGIFDLGKPAVLLTYTPPLASAASDFGGMDQLPPEHQKALEQYIESCASELEKIENFSGGLILVSLAGYGKTGTLGLTEFSDRWRIHIATLRDWTILSNDDRCNAMTLWKLGDHEKACIDRHIRILNPSDLVNLWGFWKNANFRLILQNVDILHPCMLAIGCDSASLVRVVNSQQRDEHCIMSHDRTKWIRICRHSSDALFRRDKEAPIYGAISETNEHILGCTKRGGSTWWVESPKRTERPELLSLQFQLWDCVMNWLDRISESTFESYPDITRKDIKVEISLPNFNQWDPTLPNLQSSKQSGLSITTLKEKGLITISIPESFLNQFNNPKNAAEEKIVTELLRGVAESLDFHLSDFEFDRLCKQIVRSEGARYFHVSETLEIEHLLASGHSPRPLFFDDEDTRLAELGISHLVEPPEKAGRLTGREKCRKFLQELVTKLWERIESRLSKFERMSVVSGCFSALDEITRDELQWDLSTRALLALHPGSGGAEDVLRTRRSKRAAANISNRLLIETAQYSCNNPLAGKLTMADHLGLLAEMTSLLSFAHHRDGIAYGFLNPEIVVHPNGEIDINDEFYRSTFSKYMTRRGDNITRKASEGYDKHFDDTPPSPQQVNVWKQKISSLNEAFEPEFGFTIEMLMRVRDALRELAISSNRAGGYMLEPEMLTFLQRGCGFSSVQAESFLDRLTLPLRSAWNSDFPPRCRSEDIYPWRFRRQLSLLTRPLVQVSNAPRGWLVSASFFERSIAYFLGNIEDAIFPERFFSSSKMRTYIGQQVNRRGHSFAEKVRDLFKDNGFSFRFEIEMSELGAQKKDGLGDIDVLGWDPESGNIFAVECKHLLPAITVREVVQRLEDFRGDQKAKDSLGRHIRRIDWLKQHPFSLVNVTGIAAEKINIIPALVTNDTVPMQFFKEMNFPTDQVVSFDGLTTFLSTHK